MDLGYFISVPFEFFITFYSFVHTDLYALFFITVKNFIFGDIIKWYYFLNLKLWVFTADIKNKIDICMLCLHYAIFLYSLVSLSHLKKWFFHLVNYIFCGF